MGVYDPDELIAALRDDVAEIGRLRAEVRALRAGEAVPHAGGRRTDADLLRLLRSRFWMIAGPAGSPDPGLSPDSYRILLRWWAEMISEQLGDGG